MSTFDLKDLEIIARNAQLKFEYATTSITLGTLALSLKFSPEFGTHYKSILVVGWIFLFISFLMGGWRLMMVPSLYQSNVETGKLKGRIFEIKQPKTNVLDPKTLKILSEEEVKNSISTNTLLIEESEKRLKYYQKILPYIFNTQILLLVLGLVSVGVYRILNFTLTF